MTNPNTFAQTVAIGRITAKGQMQTFVQPRKANKRASVVGNITLGPDGNLWFTAGGDVGRITAKGNLKMYPAVSKGYGDYMGPPGPSGIISGPDGTLWFQGNVHGTGGIARISTSGKLGSVIPVVGIDSNLLRLPDGQVWFEENSGAGYELGVATRSGIVVTQDLPASAPYLTNSFYPGENVLTIGRDGNLWATSDASSIVRISGLNTVAGGLDYRHRRKRAPDYAYNPNSGGDQWTNVSGTAKPTFAGVATPGAEVTLWAQRQGDNQPVSIGQVQASKTDGSWTLTSHVKLSDGNYAVTATQTGDTGPPSVLYSLAPDSSGNLSNALVIQTRHAGK